MVVARAGSPQKGKINTENNGFWRFSWLRASGRPCLGGYGLRRRMEGTKLSQRLPLQRAKRASGRAGLNNSALRAAPVKNSAHADSQSFSWLRAFGRPCLGGCGLRRRMEGNKLSQRLPLQRAKRASGRAGLNNSALRAATEKTATSPFSARGKPLFAPAGLPPAPL